MKPKKYDPLLVMGLAYLGILLTLAIIVAVTLW